MALWASCLLKCLIGVLPFLSAVLRLLVLRYILRFDVERETIDIATRVKCCTKPVADMFACTFNFCERQLSLVSHPLYNFNSEQSLTLFAVCLISLFLEIK